MDECMVTVPVLINPTKTCFEILLCLKPVKTINLTFYGNKCWKSYNNFQQPYDVMKLILQFGVHSLVSCLEINFVKNIFCRINSALILV